MDNGFLVADLIMERVCLPEGVAQRHDRIIKGDSVVRRSYWARIADMAADYRSAAHMYQGAYRSLQESLLSNEVSQDDDEQKFLFDMELRNQLRLASHQFIVYLYHLLEKVTKCCCQSLTVGLGVNSMKELIMALRGRIEGYELPEVHPCAKGGRVVRYGEMLSVTERMRYICNDIKHDGFISKGTSDNVSELRQKHDQVVPDLTDIIIDSGLVKDAVFYINALVGLMSMGSDERYIQI
ncbi:hypothetical protein [Alteromonas macleodii]|uniref:hypothetical protein n=1 Tax=Alteromonas macleodii TaxID=28108 RepID=UPI0031400D51